MLVNITEWPVMRPDLQAILAVLSGLEGGELGPTKIGDGMYQVGHHNSYDHLQDQAYRCSDHPYDARCEPYFVNPGIDEDWEGVRRDFLTASGVCDSPAQFMAKFGERLQSDPRPLVVFFTHVAKHPENRRQGGGWRWHKWGRYVGEGEPLWEYLDDEEAFDDGVYCFRIHCVDNIPHELPSPTAPLGRCHLTHVEE